MYACENMAAKIRRMEEDELKNCSPCLILPIFVAARFYIGTCSSMIKFQLRHTYFDLLQSTQSAFMQMSRSIYTH